MAAIASRIGQLLNQLSPLIGFLTQGDWVTHADEPGASNFVLGNPHEMPLTRFVDALQQHSVPQDQNWYAYKMSEPASQAIVGAALRERHKMPFRDEDVHMTNGAFAALSVALTAVVDPGDEVIFISPPWFFYEALIIGTGASPVRVKVNLQTFDLDVDAIAAAITPKTRAVIVNSPNNPTGRIYPEATLRQLGQALTDASARNGRTIYLISDEAYSRIVYSGSSFITPTAFYADSFLAYTYGKTLLTPGQRIGYLALAPNMDEREQVNYAVLMAQIITGYAFPNALLQHALTDLERTSIDIEHLQQKRDLMVGALRDYGYEVQAPEGTFYLMPRSPLADDGRFIALLAEQKVYCLPGWVFEMPGYFRICLTANDEMIERALPGFAAAQRLSVAGA
ncbi:MAG: aminotransferase class I/II-fold pyridoxal phosphate-dependent enzyme [Chloroflexota bacterium]